jgi:hypothetical protein
MIGCSRESVKGQGIPPEVRWILTFELFIDYGGGNIQGSHGSIHIAADQTGKIVGQPWMQTFMPPDADQLVTSLITFTHAPLLAFSVVHPPAENTREAQYEPPGTLEDHRCSRRRIGCA